MIKNKSKIVFAAMARENFYLREYITKFILEQGLTPVSAFMMFSYFLMDSIERQQLIKANNRLIEMADELWVFGKVSSGVKEEILLAEKLKKPIKHFAIEALCDLHSEISFKKIKTSESLER